eukprot:6197587-Pleurochrysis_carterae.AAC.1
MVAVRTRLAGELSVTLEPLLSSNEYELRDEVRRSTPIDVGRVGCSKGSCCRLDPPVLIRVFLSALVRLCIHARAFVRARGGARY